MTLIKMNKFQPIVIYPLMMTVSYLSNMVFIVISTDYYKNSNNISNQEQSTASRTRNKRYANKIIREPLKTNEWV